MRMAQMISIVLRATAFAALLCGTVVAEPQRSIHIIGRKEISVTTPSVKLADIAQISSELKDGTDDEAIIALQKIVVDKSPQPGNSSTIAAAAVLERMRTAGVNLDAVSYTLPRIVTVKRAGRVISLDEVTSAVKAALAKSGNETDIKSIAYNEGMYVVPGMTSFEARPFNVGAPGRMGFEVTAKTPGSEDVRFKVQAQVDEWKEIPVARRPLNKGEVIGPQDIMRARLNMAALPRDAVQDDDSLVGLSTSDEIGYGEFFRKPKLAIPPVVNAGGKVTILYRSNVLEVTATGTAMEPGIKGQDIRVQNDASKKVVHATVLEAGIVGVKP